MRVPQLERPRRATAGLITLDRSLEAPTPDKGLAPQGRGPFLIGRTKASLHKGGALFL
jgi:hypothetical protein